MYENIVSNPDPLITTDSGCEVRQSTEHALLLMLLKLIEDKVYPYVLTPN